MIETADKAWLVLGWAAALGFAAVAFLVAYFVADLMRERKVDPTALRDVKVPDQ